jgi:acetyl-CoA synthetase
MLPTQAVTYQELVDGFEWRLPTHFNIANACCDRHARERPKKPAIIVDNGPVAPTIYTFAQLNTLSDRLAGHFAEFGIQQGDRIALSLPQGVEAISVMLAIFKRGAIAIPIAQIYGSEATAHRLLDSGTKLLVTDITGWQKVSKKSLPALQHVILWGDRLPPDAMNLSTLLEQEREPLEVVDTAIDDPAVIFYTSGSTGPAKGVLHAHRFVLAHVPGFQMMFNLAPQPGDVFWTPSVWAWLGSLGDLVFPALYFGCPVVASPGRFSIAEAYRIIAQHHITCPFLATPIIRRMYHEPPTPDWNYRSRAVATGGEPIAPEMLAAVSDVLGCTINDDFGLTEANESAVGCSRLFTTPPGAVGRPVPGRKLAILDENGRVLPPGASGELAMSADDPIVMLGYWNKPRETGERIVDGWVRTGDRGYMDADGFFYYQGRLDNLILTSGYRVGPEEVEVQLLAHDAVAETCVVGLPDPERGEIVAAFVRPKADIMPDKNLASALQAFVKQRLAGYAYPRRIEFVETFPRTATGKIQRAVLCQRAMAR